MPCTETDSLIRIVRMWLCKQKVRMNFKKLFKCYSSYSMTQQLQSFRLILSIKVPGWIK